MLKFFRQRDWLKELETTRKQCASKSLPDLVYEHLSAPLPDKSTPLDKLSYLVVDFETTGFDPDNCDIISMGWIEVSQMQVDFASSEHIYVSNSENINHQTAVVNHIVPQMVDTGVTLEEAVNLLLQKAQGKVLVAHGKVIEKSFLDFYARKELDIPELPLLWIDTLRFEQWRSLEKGTKFGQDNRLSSVRQQYNLPQYATHNALIDSIATAELLLAQIAHTYRDKKPEFGHLFKVSQ
ncbi:3'-5' exonuclease [Vibrio sp. JC009]|uniref:3'-5' exonuclease n=1 Tax=Vibrio sp. JC009 TaxID=2912314 RepID=UPI0023AEB0EA|nr:exonuclease domain-containing protein [Vibrio sp. JC009]WED22841.1 3'-5' exonuclease [Vibrio sp. JC009]